MSQNTLTSKLKGGIIPHPDRGYNLSAPKCIHRVAMAQGKPGIWMFIFPDRENTENLPKDIKNMYVCI